jgi:hypothetical protein
MRRLPSNSKIKLEPEELNRERLLIFLKGLLICIVPTLFILSGFCVGSFVHWTNKFLWLSEWNALARGVFLMLQACSTAIGVAIATGDLEELNKKYL